MLFLFGDNMEHWGYGGQAKEMRGEPNAIGIPTKWSPKMTQESFFKDSDLFKVAEEIDKQFEKIPNNTHVIVPKAGLGTGLAQLPKKAPKIYQYILEKLEQLEKRLNDSSS